MKEYIKLFSDLNDADKYDINNIPFTFVIKPEITGDKPKMGVCNEKYKKIKVENDNVYVVDNVIPFIPMEYIFLSVLTIIPQSPLYNEEIATFYTQSNAYSRVLSDGLVIIPNSLMRFNIKGVRDFFNSIDNDGIAHKNNIYRQVCLSENTKYDTKMVEWLKELCPWVNLELQWLLNDIDSVSETEEKSKIALASYALFNIRPLDNYLLTYDFNDGNMNFYSNINDCLNDFSDYATFIQTEYNIVNNENQVRAIFVLEANDISNVDYSSLLPKLVIAYITDNLTYFTFTQK